MDYTKLSRDELISRLEEKSKLHLAINAATPMEEVVHDAVVNLPILLPSKKYDVAGEGLDHLLIEGDNILSLIALNYTHKEKIDIIYIDPPYNTGNDFIYNDKLVDDNDKNGHSKWVKFMRQRLRVASGLLKDDGVIFISIGKEELAHLIVSCDEIFGEDNRIAIVPRVAKTGGNRGKYFTPSVDYVLVYAKNISYVNGFKTEIDEKDYKESDSVGKYKTKTLYESTLDPRPNQRYYIECPDGSLCIPPGDVFPEVKKDAEFIKPQNKNDKCWRWSRERYLKENNLGGIVFKKNSRSSLVDENGNKSKWSVNKKIYLSDRLDSGNIPNDWINGIFNTQGTKEIKKLGLDFSYPKPTKLIEYLISITNKPKDITVLDFFAGSGTTGHAVLNLNEQDGGTRKFILCTNNENKICENVTHQRLKKVLVDKPGCVHGYITSDATRHTIKYKGQGTDQIIFKLQKKIIPMLQVRHNAFEEVALEKCHTLLREEVQSSTCYTVFKSNDGSHMCIFGFSPRIDLATEIKYVQSTYDNCTIYNFSYTDEEVIAGERSTPADIIGIYESVITEKLGPSCNLEEITK